MRIARRPGKRNSALELAIRIQRVKMIGVPAWTDARRRIRLDRERATPRADETFHSIGTRQRVGLASVREAGRFAARGPSARRGALRCAGDAVQARRSAHPPRTARFDAS
ncbi:MAG: hypothetical protein ABI585_09775 [Betaproteobacteria bacterium]